MAMMMCGACTVIAVGVLGLQQDSWFRQLIETWINIHALFGSLLCGLVAARHRWIARNSPHRQDPHELSRHLSRLVYLVLFLTVGASHGLAMLHWLRPGASMDSADPNRDYHMTLLWGGIALAMARLFFNRRLFRRVIEWPAQALRNAQ